MAPSSGPRGARCRRRTVPLSLLRPGARSLRKESRVPVRWSWAAGRSFLSRGNRLYAEGLRCSLKSVAEPEFAHSTESCSASDNAPRHLPCAAGTRSYAQTQPEQDTYSQNLTRAHFSAEE